MRPVILRIAALLALTWCWGPGLAAQTADDTRTLSLDGDWNFLADAAGNLQVQDLTSVQNVRPTRVPSSWQSQFTDLRDYAGVAWYWRTVSLAPLGADQVALLRFGAVDYRAEVFVNGQQAGIHEGGYLPFEFDITGLCRSGGNQIAVRVTDPGAKPSEVEGIRYAEIPHGKQNWYVQTSGLWQSVEIAVRSRMHLGAVHISAGADGNFKVDLPVVNVPLEPQFKRPVHVGAEIRDASDKVVWQATRDLDPGQAVYQLAGRLESPVLWNLETPVLYKLQAWLSSGDSQTYRFGFRTFTTRAGKFYLNGNLIYLRGALDQDFYPDTIYTPPSLDYVRDEMRKAKALGLNMLRCHIKVPDPRYLQAADEVGLLIWYEIPNWDKLTEDSKRRGLATLAGMADRDWNHPSIVIVSILNESWGAHLKEPADRQWLKQAYLEAKKMVPGWLVEDNSACCDNFHMAGDLADTHTYNAIPDYAATFDQFVGDLAQRPRWLYSPYGDATPRGDEPLMLSEFGNWGLPKVPETKPWWFSRDFGGQPLTLPADLEQRFADYQYASLFPTLDALSEATQWQQFRALKYEIESLRLHPQIQGYVITEFTDLNWEANGLLDMWRRPKVYADALSRLQQNDLILAWADKRNLTTGAEARLDVYFSHHSEISLAGAQVVWRLEGTALKGDFAVNPLPPGSAAKVGAIEFTVPSLSAPAKMLLRVYLVTSGKTVSENSLELFFYPEPPPELPPPVSFHDPAGRLRRLVNEMRAHNYLAPSGKEAMPVLVTSAFDDEVKEALRRGSLVILMPSDRQPLPGGLEIVPRSGDNLDGNWISAFSWIRKDHSVFRAIGFDTLAGFEMQAVAPITVVRGIPPANFADVLAGSFYGWIHSSVGTVVQAKCGRGKLLIVTLSLATTYGTDPYATYLLDNLMNYAVSGFAPTLELPL